MAFQSWLEGDLFPTARVEGAALSWTLGLGVAGAPPASRHTIPPGKPACPQSGGLVRGREMGWQSKPAGPR